MSDTEKTEKPTPKRLLDAERDGDVLTSRDLSTALVIAAGCAWLAIGGAGFVASLQDMLRAALVLDMNQSLSAAVRGATLSVALPMLALFLATIVASLANPFLLGVRSVRLSAAMPKWSRLNPAAGLKRMTSAAALSELAKSLAKVALIAGASAAILHTWHWRVVQLATNDVQDAAKLAARAIVETVAVGTAMLTVIAFADVPLQIAQRYKRLAMSRDEVLREMRESEGSPELKRARRSRQYALASLSVRSAMKNATVVLTNPTHFAVALRYLPDRDTSPVVVARGADEVARAIRDLARGRDVPCLEYPSLTRALYFTSKVGDNVHESLYLAIATILAFVMNLEAVLAAQGRQPDVTVPDSMRFTPDGAREA